MMLALKIIGILSLLIYTVYLVYGLTGFNKTKIFELNGSHVNTTRTCIIICARNEENNLEKCLYSIFGQNFDLNLLEIILVNDGSTDNTLSFAQKTLANFKSSYQIINNTETLGKKTCITSAIEICNADLIITRDADTFTQNPNWLKTIVSYHEETQKQFIICPLEIGNKNGFLNQLQFFENNALAILTGGFAF
ncbi:MAG TPA: glycosyltransferase, partial [Bacteroidia bacterium]|nr:glycosyltransferase [Bacteroidia bacterium]